MLVFLGVLVTTYQQLIGGETSDRVLGRFKRAAVASLAVFLLSLVSLVLDIAWLGTQGGGCFYGISLATFFVQLVAIGGVASWTTIWVLLKG